MTVGMCLRGWQSDKDSQNESILGHVNLFNLFVSNSDLNGVLWEHKLARKGTTKAQIHKRETTTHKSQKEREDVKWYIKKEDDLIFFPTKLNESHNTLTHTHISCIQLHITYK